MISLKKILSEATLTEAGMNPVKKVVNAILKKHKIEAMKTYASSVRGAHNIINGGYRWEGDWHLGFYGNVPQDVIEKVAAEMEKAGVKYVKVTKGHISADFTKTGLNEDWSQKYKNSIDCNNPKGFSQKAHCAGKNESMNEVAARYIEPKRVEAFLNKYPKVEELMQKIVDKVKDVDRGYQIFLHYKDDKGQERYFGGKKDTQSKSSNVKGLGRTALNKTGKSFNSKTSYKYEWNGKMDYPTWGELFQYVWNKKNENKSNNIDEAIHPEVYREFMQACNDAGLNSFQIFGLHVLVYILTLGATGVTILSALGIAQLAKDAKDTFNNWNAGRKLNPEKVKAIVKDFENKVNKLEGGRKKFFQGIINKMKKTNPENKSALVSINKDLEYYAKAYGIKEESMNLEEKLNLFLEKNVPTDPQKWAASIAAAKKKFDVYPSAYANGWAAKNYKEKGGGWKTAK